MATLTHPKGRTVTVPDESVDYYTSKGWQVAGSKGKSSSDVVEIPDGDPSEDWTNAQLDALAARDGIELNGATKKADKLSAITEARSAGSGSSE